LIVGTELITKHLDEIVAGFDEVDFVGLRPTALVLHGGAPQRHSP
jgi:hypothetical protein